MAGVVQVNSDEYWTDEEHRAWDEAFAEALARNPPPPLRRNPRPVRRGRLTKTPEGRELRRQLGDEEE